MLINWANETLLKEHTFQTCYIAIIEGEEGYDLEVEIANSVIGATFGAGSLNQARRLADELQAHLTAKGKKVCQTRKEWEEYDNS